MASSNDITFRQIFVDTQYPIPPYVDGIVPVNPEPPTDEEIWQNSTPEGPVIESPYGPIPVPLDVTDQVIITAPGGTQSVNAVLVIQEVEFVEDYEIRVTMIAA